MYLFREKSRTIFSNRLIFEPIAKVRCTLYMCDSRFYIDEIIDMYKEHDVNGIIYTDGEECVWYELKNNSFKKLMDKDVFLRNQSKKGGQSANARASKNIIQCGGRRAC